MAKHYDLVVLGAGPAGEKAAAKAAYFKKKVAIVEAAADPGGAGVHTGTIPSKTLKETALYLSGKMERGLYGVERTIDRNLSIGDFYFRKNAVTKTEVESINDNLTVHKIDVYHGIASFEDPHTIRVQGDEVETISADFILIATGSYPFHPDIIPFDGVRVHDSDSILDLARFPRSIAVIGAGVIGCEYTTIFATMGTEVHLIEGRDSILPFIDAEITKDLLRQMAESGISVRFNTSIEKIEKPVSDEAPIRVSLVSSKAPEANSAGGSGANGSGANGSDSGGREVIEVDMVLYAAGRSGRSAELACEKAGVKIGKREIIEVNSDYQSSVPHIYAVGDVIGFPALASTSMDQGRIAVTHMFHTDGSERLAPIFPYGIYTIPEVSMVGLTEAEAKGKGIDYGVGRAHHRNMARGKIMGARDGFLKLVFDRQTEKILGVHIIGSLASEIIHYGVSLVESGKTLDDLISAVFNFPSLHDLYKYAAYDGLGNLSGNKVREV